MIDNLIFAPTYLYISLFRLQASKIYEHALCIEFPLACTRYVNKVFGFIDLASGGRAHTSAYIWS